MRPINVVTERNNMKPYFDAAIDCLRKGEALPYNITNRTYLDFVLSRMEDEC